MNKILPILALLLTACAPTYAPKITDSHGARMALVPAGEFTMGRDGSGHNERPAHRVYLDAFYMDLVEVTNVLYKDCEVAGACNLPAGAPVFLQAQFADHPISLVDWDLANTFCRWRGARLPSEAEWEKAARGTDDRVYPWGNTFGGEYANYCDVNCRGMGNKNFDDKFSGDAPVGFFAAGTSPYGIYDMAGNVQEWVADWKSDDYYAASPYRNPQGPEAGTGRVVRGGSFASGETSLTVSHRSSYEPFEYYPYLGFRCARDPSMGAGGGN